jgi:2-amino-4-hydroxy-6-hydroxymethyldihydropteridine diphosphokinase
MGRQRNERWGPRTIDLDLLLYDEQIVDEPDLKIPHPQMHLRSFVLKGMCELAVDLVHPRLNCMMGQLYQRLNGAELPAISVWARPRLQPDWLNG